MSNPALQYFERKIVSQVGMDEEKNTNLVETSQEIFFKTWWMVGFTETWQWTVIKL